LADPKRFASRNRAAVTRDGEKVFKVIPIEHRSIMQF
jgi:hypothetical protein